jgi:phosphoribosylaminoimidazole-succinocarboxamide synthase
MSSTPSSSSWTDSRAADVLSRADAAVVAGEILEATSLDIGVRFEGKVRDIYTAGDFVVAVTTDRLSAFDRVLASIPFKGHVLNLTSAFWFEQTRHIVANHFISAPHPNVTVCKRAIPFKVEFVVRAYLTGSTGTSIWVHYDKGTRKYCGHDLPDGMRKNQILPRVLVTPTTKDDLHDRPISAEEVVSEGLMTQQEWDFVSAKALEVFAFGQAEAKSRGLILVDTKYEFGRDARSGEIILIDEVHTPDSSRYWLAGSYEERFAQGLEPQNIDKEILRLHYKAICDPYAPGPLPPAPRDLVATLSSRYIQLYETITGRNIEFPPAGDATILKHALCAAVAPLFPPAKIAVALFPSCSGDSIALDAACNAPYSPEWPVMTRVAVRPVSFGEGGIASPGAKEKCEAVKAAGCKFALVAAGSTPDADATSFVEMTSSLPTIRVGASGAPNAVVAADMGAAARFLNAFVS